MNERSTSTFERTRFALRGVPVLLLSCLCLAIAAAHLLTTIAPYDDEGYVMMTLQTFADHQPLYEQTHTQYGPAFYWLSAPIHTWFGLPLTQHGVRFKTAILWTIYVLLSCGIVHRLTGSRSASWGTALLLAIHLDKLALEPGHPQELALLLTLLVLWCVGYAGTYRRSVWWIAGGLTALCGMTKLNCGLVLALPLLLVGLWQMPDKNNLSIGLRKALLAIVGCIGVAVIALTMARSNIGQLSIVLPIVLAIAWCVVVIVVSGVRCRSVSLQASAIPMVSIICSSVISSIAIALLTVWNGTSWSMLYWGLVGQHGAFTQTFFHPIEHGPMVLASIAILTICYRNRKLLSVAGLVCLLIAIALTASTATQPLVHGLVLRGSANWLAIAGPCLSCAIVLQRRRMMQGRILLAGLTALSPWIAFPTPGTQVMLGTIPAWITLGVVTSDACQRLFGDRPELKRLLIGAFSFASFMLAVIVGCTTWSRWQSNDSLNLPGSDWIHIDRDMALSEQRLVDAIQETKATHIVFDGHTHNRFYFWTGLKPLTAANPTFWPQMLTEREQMRWHESIERTSSLCVVVPPESDALATQRVQELRSFMLENTVLKYRNEDGWEVRIRNSPNP